MTYAAFNSYAAAPTAQQRAQVVARLARLASRAGTLGVRLGLEPVNRYESYMVNTLDEGAGLIRDSGAKNLFLHMDTFHTNIEEGDFAAAIHRNADLLGLCPCGRQQPRASGGGVFRPDGLFQGTGLGGLSRGLHGGKLLAEGAGPGPGRRSQAVALRLARPGPRRENGLAGDADRCRSSKSGGCDLVRKEIPFQPLCKR